MQQWKAAKTEVICCNYMTLRHTVKKAELLSNSTQGIKFSRNLFSRHRISKQALMYTWQLQDHVLKDAGNIYQTANDYADLISSDVGDNQLRLIIQHLLKVWHVPVFIRGVTVKALNNNSITKILYLV